MVGLLLVGGEGWGEKDGGGEGGLRISYLLSKVEKILFGESS